MKAGRRATTRKRVREERAVYSAAAPSPRRLLLDTQAWLWWNADDRRLGAATRSAIRDAIVSGGEVLFSVASAWEIAIKAGLGKLVVPRLEAIPTELERDGFQSLPIAIEHALGVSTLPDVHRDPFDRLLLAQAKLGGLTLVTADPIMRKYDVALLWAGD